MQISRLRPEFGLSAGMHVPASAVSLARSMSWLSRTRATGVLRVVCWGASCELALVDGIIRAAVSHAPGGSVGDLRECVCELFRWPSHELRFTAGATEIFDCWLSDPPPTAALILHGMRFAVATPAHGAHGAIEHGCELTAWGKSLLEAAGESAALAALQAGYRPELLAADGGGELASIVGALRAFGALAPRTDARVDYTLLLRKRAEVRRRAAARELLDLPLGAVITPAAARTALRRLTSHLHPDCLGPDAPASARAVSHEVMQALTRAASSLR